MVDLLQRPHLEIFWPGQLYLRRGQPLFKWMYAGIYAANKQMHMFSVTRGLQNKKFRNMNYDFF